MTSFQSSPAPLELLLDHKGRHRRFPVPDRISLGRGEEADIRLDDPRLSRLHVRLVRDGAMVKVTDLGSSNGTRVDGQEISQVRLGAGSRVELSPDTIVWILAEGQEIPQAGAAPASEQRPTTARRPAPSTARPAPAAASSRTAPAAAAAADAPEPAVRSAGSAARPAKKRGPGLIIAGVGAVAAVILVFLATRPDPEAAATARLSEVRQIAETRDYARALEEAEALVAAHPESAAAIRVKAMLADWEAGREQRDAVRDELKTIAQDQVREPLALTLERMNLLRENRPLALTDAEWDEREERFTAWADQRSETLVQGLEGRIRAALDRQDFARADQHVTEGEESALLTDRDRARLEIQRRRLDRTALAAGTRLLKELDAMAPKRALERLDQEARRFAGLPVAGRMKARRALFTAAIAQAEAEAESRRIASARTGDEPAEEEVVTTAPSADLLEAMGKAESLAAERRFAAAAEAFATASAAAGSEEQRAGIAERTDRMRRLDAVMTALIARMNEERRAFTRIDLGNGMTGSVRAADAERVELSVGAGARVRWYWKRVSANRMARLMDRAMFTGGHAVDEALVLLEWGDADAALAQLTEVFERSPDHRERAERLAAEARGMDAVPEGGFTVFAGRLLTAAEHVVAKREARIADLARTVTESGPGGWKEAATALEVEGEDGQRALTTALETRLGRHRETVASMPQLSPANLRALQTGLFTQLEQRREAALKLIFDTKRYPYPYAPNQAEVQNEVDELVQRVRVLWETPSEELLERFPEIRPFLEDSSAVTEMLAKHEIKAEGAAGILAAIDERLALKNFRGNPDNAKLLDHYVRVKAYNDSLGDDVIGAGERACHAATNAYRVMMGRRAVMIAPKLVIAARGHSQEMKDLGYFAHNSPTPGRKSPGDRARLAGWGGGVSENIARGQPTGPAAVRSWVGSSGHHRNILGARWTHLGCGQAENAAFWTQNFGAGASEPPTVAPPRRKKDRGS